MSVRSSSLMFGGKTLREGRTLSRRELLLGVAAANVIGQGAHAATGKFDAIVGADGHASLEAAIRSAPANPERPFRILVPRGTWREQLTIDKPDIHLIGEDRTRSVIVGNAFAGGAAPDGQPRGTRRSATLTIAAPGFA